MACSNYGLRGTCLATIPTVHRTHPREVLFFICIPSLKDPIAAVIHVSSTQVYARASQVGVPEEVSADTRDTTFNVFGNVVDKTGGEPISSGSSSAVVGGLSKLLEAPTSGGAEDATGVAGQANSMVRFSLLSNIWSF